MTRFGVYMYLIDRKRLARTMKVQKVTARQLSQVAGWRSHTYLQRLLKGEVNTLRPEPAVRIAAFLGMDLSDLFMSKLSNVSAHSQKVGQR